MSNNQQVFHLSPQFIASKLDMPTLARDFQKENIKHAKQHTLRKYKIGFVLALLLVTLIAVVVGVFVFRNQSSIFQQKQKQQQQHEEVLTLASISVKIKENPTPLLIPSTVNVPRTTLNTQKLLWVPVSPSLDFKIHNIHSPILKNEMDSLTSAYKQRLFPYTDCQTSHTPNQVSEMDLNYNPSALGESQPDAYRITVTSKPSISITFKTSMGLANALDSLSASLVVDSLCVYQVPVFDSQVQSAVFNKRAVRINSLTRSNVQFDSKMKNVIRIAASAKLNTLILKLDPQFGMKSNLDTVSLDQSLTEAMSRGVDLVPDLDFVSGKAWSKEYTITCENIGPNVNVLNLNLAVVRTAQLAWFTEIRTKLGNKVSGVFVNTLFDQDYLECLKVTDQVIKYWQQMFDGLRVYYPSTNPPPPSVMNVLQAVSIVSVIPKIQAPAVNLSGGPAILHISTESVLKSVKDASLEVVPFRGTVPDGVIADVPMDLILEDQTDNLGQYLFLVSMKSWFGWAQPLDVMNVQSQLDLFRTWVV